MSFNRIAGSFRDPSGYLFTQDRCLYRFVAPTYARHFDLFLSSGLYDAATSRGLLIPHEEVTSASVPTIKGAYKVLRPERVEFISADQGMNRDPGLLDIYARVKDPEQIDAVLGEIDATVARYRDRPPDARRLADLKSRLKYDFLMTLDTPDRVASSLARVIGVTGGIGAVDRLYSTYERITPEDIQTAARKYLDPDQRTIAVLRGK